MRLINEKLKNHKLAFPKDRTLEVDGEGILSVDNLADANALRVIGFKEIVAPEPFEHRPIRPDTQVQQQPVVNPEVKNFRRKK